MGTNLVIDQGTFRQLAVLLAMQGLLTNARGYSNTKPDQIAATAVAYADALLRIMTTDSPTNT